MSLAIKLMKCNVNCKNCYEKKIRENSQQEPNWFQIYRTLVTEIDKHNSVTIHGGEPLCIPIDKLEILLRYIHKKKGYTGIQTNLLLLTNAHVELFKKYKTHVGISLDSNMFVRGYDSKIIFKNIKKLKDLRKSIICVLWKNSSDGIIHFIDKLKGMYKIRDIRLNPGIDFEGNGNEIDNIELATIYKRVFDWLNYEKDMMVQPIRDIIDMLLGSKNRTCLFNKCDPFYTQAEVPIFEDGSLGNCLKVTGANDGLKILRSEKRSNERYELLEQTDCIECPFWLMCFGGCPGAGIDNNWRRKTRFCVAYKKIFIHINYRLKCLFPNLKTIIDFRDSSINSKDILFTIQKSTWQEKYRTNVEKVLKQNKKKKQTDPGHGDSPHGDEHGDHLDRSKK